MYDIFDPPSLTFQQYSYWQVSILGQSELFWSVLVISADHLIYIYYLI